MAPKTIKKKSSLKRKSPRRPRSASTIPRRRAVSPAGEELFAKAFCSSPHPIGITELETGRSLEVNDACLEIFGFRRDEVVGHTTLMLGIWPDPQERVQFIDRLKAEGKVRNLEVAMRMKSGEFRQFLISTDLIELGSTRCLLTIGNDITERKRAEEALRQSEERWQLAATGTTDGIWDWDVARHRVFLSARWKEVRGYREEEIGMDETEWSSRIHPEDSPGVMATVQSYFNKEIPTFDCEYRTRRKNGTYFWIRDRGIAVWDEQGQVVRMVGSETEITEQKRAEEALRRVHDELEQRVAERTTELGRSNKRLKAEIAERKQAEEAVREKQIELQQSQAQLQDLTAKLFTAQDSERQRIARDLHDDFSQRLAAVAIDVASLQRQPLLLPELIGKALAPIREELEQLANDLHDLAYRLHPPPLRHLGLQAAIEDYLHKAIERTGIPIMLKAKGVPESIPLDWSICLFRVLQESLQNVAKHADATEVQVRLSGSSKGIGLSVIDNGKGFDARDKSIHRKGLGLNSMQERLRLLNGFLNIHSRPVEGTKVCAWIPFQEKTP